jgi:hypothetical protein
MDPLDLAKAPPRSPRAQAGSLSLLMLARSIDKFRAAQPGGNLGAYQIEGFSIGLLDELGIDRAEFAKVVAQSAGDAEVATWVAQRTTPEQRDAADQKIEARRIADRIESPGWTERYPIALTLPPETPLIDMLAADDAAAFLRSGGADVGSG